MMPTLKKIWLSLATLLLLSAPSLGADTIFLYLLTNKGNVGERNQVLGIAESLRHLLPADTVQKEFETQNADEFVAAVTQELAEGSGHRGIIIAAEESSIETLKQLKPQPNLIIAHSAHQYTKNHEALKNLADIIALPRHALSEQIIHVLESPYTAVVSTTGVAHNLTPTVITEAYNTNKDRIPAAGNYIGVILGGDAPSPDKEMRYYTDWDARHLARYLAPKTKKQNAHLLILNGPRTGKHDPKTGKVLETSHRNGVVDPVTQAFIQELQKQGLTQGKDFTLFDFQFGQPSLYQTVLGALYTTKSPMYVAGESTSMVSETADCLPQGLVTAFMTMAMNKNHINHCRSEQRAGRINLLLKSKSGWLPSKAASTHDAREALSASDVIAEAIFERLQTKAAPQN